MTKEITIRSRLAEFKDAFQAGIDGIVKASEIYVAALDDNPKNADTFRDEFADYIPSSAWSGFEAVGRKWMHPRLLMGGVADRKKNNVIKKLAYNTQERIFSHERFDLLTSDGDKLSVDLLEVTPEQAEQLCDGIRIRNLSEQRAWLESQKAKKASDEAEILPYVVSGGKVTFRRGVSLTRAEMKRLIQEM